MENTTNALVLDVEVKVVQVDGSIQFSNFNSIKEKVNGFLDVYKGLVLTDDNKQEIKKAKADLNKVKGALSAERISVKKSFIKPLELFENQVKEIDALIQSAVTTLDLQVKEQEDAEKLEKTKNVSAYFNELKSIHPSLDFIDFHDLGLNVTLSVSEKKLKEQVDEYIDQRLLDLIEIETDPNASRLLSKYRLSKNLQQSRIELNRELQQEEVIESTKSSGSNLKPSEVPKPSFINDTPEEVVTVSFKVTAPVSKLKALKEYLKLEGIIYE